MILVDTADQKLTIWRVPAGRMVAALESLAKGERLNPDKIGATEIAEPIMVLDVPEKVARGARSTLQSIVDDKSLTSAVRRRAQRALWRVEDKLDERGPF